MKTILHYKFLLLTAFAALGLCLSAARAGTVSTTFSFQQGNLTQDGNSYGSGTGYSGMVDGSINDGNPTALWTATTTVGTGNAYKSPNGLNGQQFIGLFAYDLTELNSFIAANTSANSSVAVVSVSLTLISNGGAVNNSYPNFNLYQTEPFTANANWNTTDGSTAWSSPWQTGQTQAAYGWTGGGSPLTGNIAGTTPGANATLITAGNPIAWGNSTNFISTVTNALAQAGHTLYLMAAPSFLANADSRVYFHKSNDTTQGNRPLLQITLAITTTASPATWTGASDTSWAMAGNWSPSGVPGTDAPIIFNGSSLNHLSTVLNQAFTIYSLSVTNPAGPVSIGGGNALTVDAGGIDLSAATQNLMISAPVVLGYDQSWNVGSGQTLSLSGAVTGSGNLTITGAGKVSLGAANVLPNGASAGNLTVNGTLDLKGTAQAINGLSGNGVLDNVAGGGTGVLTVGTNAAASSFSGKIQNTSGTLAMVYTGTNTLSLVGTNTFSGGFTINGPGIVNSSGSLAGTNYCFGTGPVVLNAGTLYPLNSYTFTNALTLNGGTLRVGGSASHLLTWSGPVSVTADSSLSCDGGTAGITLSGSVANAGFTLTDLGGGTASTISGVISGTGTIMPNFTGATLILNAANTFSGTNRAVLGTLKIGNSNALQNATLDLNAADSGTVNLNNLSATLGALTGSRNLTLGNGTVSIGNNNASTLYEGVLSGNGALTKIGSGTLTLDNASTYAGNTTISAGTLALSGGGSVASSPNIIVAGGATFDVSTQSPNFVLNGRTLTNSSAGAVFNGSGDGTTGTLSLVYNGANPCFVLTNGTLTLSSSTVITVNNTGAILGGGHHTIIGAATTGIHGLVTGTLPSVMVTGNGAAAAVSLQINGTGGLDLVVVSSTPPTAVINSVKYAGGNLILQGTNGASSGTYAILTSTNVALPLASWTTNTTGTFTAGGTFSNAIPVNTEPKRFFDLKQP